MSSSVLHKFNAKLDALFSLQASGSSVGTEVRAGFTTFLTMAYILFVNPAILSKAITIDGVFPQLLTATALAAASGSLIMGLLARYPFALAPGMGLNAYFTFSVVLGQGVPWQTALGAVFVSGMFFLLLSMVGIRELIIKAIPADIRRATAAGIGFFLAIIGCVNAGLIVADPATLVRAGSFHQAGPLIASAGLVITTVLLALNIRGAIVIGIAAATAAAILSGAPVYAGHTFAGFTHGIMRAPVWPKDIFMAMDVWGALKVSMIGPIFAFLFVDFFDTAGTLMGLAEKAGLTDKNGHLPRATQAFSADALATSIGAIYGSSPTTAYIESAAGIQDGGRTGLTAVVVALLFLASLFFWPLASVIPTVATAPALIIVGAMMMTASAEVNWHDYRTSVPAFLTIIGMPLTYSISNGIAFGIISYTLINMFSGRARSVHWIMYVLAVILAVKLGMD